VTAPPAHRPARPRLDQAVVAAELAPSRERARALILAGRVLVDGERWDKPGRTVPDGSRLEITPGRRPFASRGGEKLAGVLAPLGIDPAGWRCLDVGASTGGFTDVLLRRDAAHVTAVDVGRGLLDDRLRRDPRVRVVEGVNARHLRPEQVELPYDLATIDVSFISLTLVLPRILPLVPHGRLLALVKPQFESERRDVGRGGVVRSASVRAAAVERVASFLAERNWGIEGVRASPLAGPKGNREIFLASTSGPGMERAQWQEALTQEVHRGVG
jgi:23S rRNA (cytidine1920-2'-O)/16S rRNA (cytidine1409-2'-O)-methyltransferase